MSKQQTCGYLGEMELQRHVMNYVGRTSERRKEIEEVKNAVARKKNTKKLAETGLEEQKMAHEKMKNQRRK